MYFDFLTRQFKDLNTAAEKPAVIGQDRTLTWKQLHSEVANIKKSLSTVATKTSCAVIYGQKEASFVSSMLACLELGIPYTPFDSTIPEARLIRVCELANAQVALNCTTTTLPLPFSIQSSSGALTENAASTLQISTPKLAPNLVYIIFTSGSTGEPKGVQIDRHNTEDLIHWLTSEDFDFNSGDVLLNQCSFGFDVSFFDTVSALHFGGTLVLQGSSELKSSTPFLSRLGEMQPTIWSSTPSALSLALTTTHFDQAHLPLLSDFYLAGEAVHKSLAERLKKKFPKSRLWNAYGPTEATVITTLIELSEKVLSTHQHVPIGVSKPHVEMRTSADDGVSEGELWIIGPNVSPGYVNRPDLNTTRFFNHNGTRAYRTGDVGYRQGDIIFYKGRIDNQIKLHGYRIELDEIDIQVMRLADIEIAATVPLRIDGDVKKLVCFIKTKTTDATDRIATIKQELAKTLPSYMIPSQFISVDEVPYNSNQKIDKNALLARLQ